MALTSTLGSPGIEIREVDNSIRLDSSTATTIYIPGFAAQGPVDEVMSIGTINDFETIYGVPTNAAERYFYYTVKAILDNSGNGATVLCSRLPYGTGKGDTVSNAYTMLAYPAVPVVKKKYYKKYSCLKEADNKYKISFKIDDITVSYECLKAKADTASEWKKIENTKNVTTNTYTFSILDDNKGYTLKSSTEKEATILNDETYYSFDQYILDDKSKIENAFKVGSNSATLEEYYISVDDDKIVSDKLTITKIGAAKIPELGALISTETDGFKTEGFNAPELSLSVTANDAGNLTSFVAKGLIASESVDNKYIVHISYTIISNTDDPVPCGSIYLKLSYNSNVTTSSNAGMTSGTIESKFVEAFDISESYDGQYSGQSASESSKFADEITYIVGSPVTY